jgi:hypothetical protein
MQGFLGPSPTPGVWRLYQNHALDEYFDIDERYIQACAPHPDEGVRLWILRGSPMDHVVKRATPAEVDYLSGPIADQAVRRAEAGAPAEALDPAKVTACPPCPSRSP